MSTTLETYHLLGTPDTQSDLVSANGGTGGLAGLLSGITELASAAGTVITAVNGNPAPPNGPPPVTTNSPVTAQVQNAVQQVPPWAWIAGAGVLGLGVVLALK